MGNQFSGTKTEFCRRYKINRANFCGWINRRRKTCPPGRSAILDFLKAKYKPITCNNTIVTESVNIVTNKPTLDEIIYLDLDNCSDFLRWLEYKNYKTDNILIFCFTSPNSKQKPFIIDISIHLITSLTTCKDGADHNITFSACIHNSLLSKDIKFSIVSDDGFIDKTAELLRVTGRIVQYVKSEQWD